MATNYAVVDLSRTRQDKTFGGLALDGELSRRGAEARCGLQVIAVVDAAGQDLRGSGARRRAVPPRGGGALRAAGDRPA
jgi:hypothetical protein